MTGTCEKADCTVAATGKCLLSFPSPAECLHFRANGAPSTPKNDQAKVSPSPQLETKPEPGLDVADQKAARRTFHSGVELGVQEAAEIMAARYGHVIAILGSTDVGKTCFLSSLYLMASGGSLPSDYLFGGSKSLQAFEDRARGLREWEEGKLANQLVDHTIVADKRQPSLLHLGIREAYGERRRYELLLTDLPGEWTDHLIARASAAEGFRFLSRADGIVLVVDGTKLISDETRHAELQAMIYFADRLATNVQVSTDTPFVLLVSKSDEIEMKTPPAAEELRDHIQKLGYPVTIILAAAISRTPDKVENGTGVFEAIETILRYQPTRGKQDQVGKGTSAAPLHGLEVDNGSPGKTRFRVAHRRAGRGQDQLPVSFLART